MEFAVGPLELLDGLRGLHRHGAYSLFGIRLFDEDLWWRSFTSLLWMVMVDGQSMVFLLISLLCLMDDSNIRHDLGVMCMMMLVPLLMHYFLSLSWRGGYYMCFPW
jgi:hypothetical protein